jgi:hypothetical protein
MSLLGLLNTKNRNPLAPPPNQTTYTQFVYNMQSKGTNDLVERNAVDTTFRPPLAQTTYQETIFQEQRNRNA